MVGEGEASPELRAFAEKFRVARRAHGLTQGAIGEQVGMDQSQISEIERLQANPTINTLSRLARAVGTDLCDLVCTSDTHCTDRIQL